MMDMFFVGMLFGMFFGIALMLIPRVARLEERIMNKWREAGRRDE